MRIQLILNIPKLKTTKEAKEFANNLAEHILNTYNDDASIQEFWTQVPKEVKTE